MRRLFYFGTIGIAVLVVVSGWSLLMAEGPIEETSSLSEPSVAAVPPTKIAEEKEDATEVAESIYSGPWVSAYETKEKQGDTVIRYGKVRRFSSSGDLAFWYDKAAHPKPVGMNGSYHWFWAPLSYADDADLDRKLEMIVDAQDNQVFKIVGEKVSDDCGYFDGICLENILIKKIIPYQEGASE